MDEKTTQNAKIIEKSHIYYQDIYENCDLLSYTTIIRAVVYGGDILSFHFFEALNDNFEA